MYNIVNDRGREWGSCCGELLSPSVRKVRIEIPKTEKLQKIAESPSVRKVRIEIHIRENFRKAWESPSVRKVRIEIDEMYQDIQRVLVTFCEEGAD